MREDQFVQEARRGNPGAWEAITRLHQEPVFRFAYLLLGDPDDAEDVTQETFVRAFYALKRFDERRPLRPWLLRIAARTAHNWHRSAVRHKQALDRLAREPDLRAQEDTESRDAGTIWTAVRRLNPSFQQVIFLRYFLELSEEETASATGAPAGTVKSRLHRGLRELRRLLASEYPELTESHNT